MAKLKSQTKDGLRVVHGPHIIGITPEGVEVPEFLVQAARDAGAVPVSGGTTKQTAAKKTEEPK